MPHNKAAEADPSAPLPAAPAAAEAGADFAVSFASATERSGSVDDSFLSGVSGAGVGYDTSGDGQNDVLGIDSTGDGRVDTVAYDTSGDGCVDTGVHAARAPARCACPLARARLALAHTTGARGEGGGD